jgi:hypothetical protein
VCLFSSDLDSNIALNKPAYQLNTFIDANNFNFSRTASLAVDGVSNASSQPSATIMISGNRSWWSVDLGQSYNVIMINVADFKNTNFRNYHSPLFFGENLFADCDFREDIILNNAST